MPSNGLTTSMDITHASFNRTAPILSLNLCNRHTRLDRTVKTLPRYLKPTFLTQRYRSQLRSELIDTYNSLSRALTLQTHAFEASLAPDALDQAEEASAARYAALDRILVFLADCDSNDQTRDDGGISAMTSVEAICRVVIPINVLQDEFSPYHRHRPAFTATLMVDLYETLRYKIDLENCWAEYPDVLLWGTMSGVYISRGNARDKELWFSSQLAKGVRGWNAKTGQLRWEWEWNTIRHLLRNFYWNEELVAEEFKVRSCASFCHDIILSIVP